MTSTGPPGDAVLWPASRQAAAIASGALSSRDLLELHLQRIDALDGAINSVITLDADQARIAADAADRAVAERRSLGLLHGLPVTVKDAIETAGLRSTGGSPSLSGHVPESDAPVVASLRAAGAIVFGKTNLPCWSNDLQTYNDLFGRTDNPWDPALTPGGSSGGAAAAVAMGFTSFETGTDIGGSIRLPSSWCGVYGHKPSHGLIPTLGYLECDGGGVTEVDINVFGPIARSAVDLDILLSVTAAPNPAESVAWRLDLPPAGVTSLRGVRIAVWPDDPACPVAGEVRERIERTAQAIAAAGGIVDTDARPPLDVSEVSDLALSLLSANTSPAVGDESFAAARSALGDAGITMTHRTWLALDRRRALVRDAWADFFSRYDVLLCPVSPALAIPHDHGSFASRVVMIDGVQRPYRDLVTWTTLVGAAYLPSTAVPLGLSAAGLPIGVQVVGPYLHDRRTIAVAGLVGDLPGCGYSPPPAATS